MIRLIIRLVQQAEQILCVFNSVRTNKPHSCDKQELIEARPVRQLTAEQFQALNFSAYSINKIDETDKRRIKAIGGSIEIATNCNILLAAYFSYAKTNKGYIHKGTCDHMLGERIANCASYDNVRIELVNSLGVKLSEEESYEVFGKVFKSFDWEKIVIPFAVWSKRGKSQRKNGHRLKKFKGHCFSC